MQLNWLYNVESKEMSLNVGDYLYKSIDGGQTILKYKNNVYVKTIKKYPSQEDSIVYEDGSNIRSYLRSNHIDQTEDEWPLELEWILENFGDEVGEIHEEWSEGYMNRNGELEDIGVWRGTGVNNPEDKISTNRLGIPASIQEWWDYDLLGTLDKPSEEPGAGKGKRYMIHKETKKCIVTGQQNPPFPCCDFPIIHGPYEISLEEVIKISQEPEFNGSEVLAEIMRNI